MQWRLPARSRAKPHSNRLSHAMRGHEAVRATQPSIKLQLSQATGS